MARKKDSQKESWGTRMKDFGGGDITFLSTDGEVLIFIVVGLPVLMESSFKSKPGERIGCPVVTDGGYQLFITGKRAARKISKYERVFDKSALMIIRHGAEGDVNAKYEVSIVDEKETFKRLLAIKEEDFEPSMIQESIDAAKDVLKK